MVRVVQRSLESQWSRTGRHERTASEWGRVSRLFCCPLACSEQLRLTPGSSRWLWHVYRKSLTSALARQSVVSFEQMEQLLGVPTVLR